MGMIRSAPFLPSLLLAAEVKKRSLSLICTENYAAPVSSVSAIRPAPLDKPLSPETYTTGAAFT